MNRGNLQVILNYYNTRADENAERVHAQIAALRVQQQDLETTIRLLDLNPVQAILKGSPAIEMAAAEVQINLSIQACELLDKAIASLEKEIYELSLPVQQKLSLIQTSFGGLAKLKEFILSGNAAGNPITPYQKVSFEAQKSALTLLIRDLPPALLKENTRGH